MVGVKKLLDYGTDPFDARQAVVIQKLRIKICMTTAHRRIGRSLTADGRRYTWRGKAATKTGLNRQNDFEAESFLFPGKWQSSFCLQMILPIAFHDLNAVILQARCPQRARRTRMSGLHRKICYGISFVICSNLFKGSWFRLWLHEKRAEKNKKLTDSSTDAGEFQTEGREARQADPLRALCALGV
jgi:hypothetical protein